MAGPARVERLGRLLFFKEGGSERVQRVHEGRGLSEGHELSVGSSRGLLAVAVDGSGNDAVRRRRGIALARRRVTFRGLGRYDILSVGHVDGATLVERPRAAVYLADEKSLAASK